MNTKFIRKYIFVILDSLLWYFVDAGCGNGGIGASFVFFLVIGCWTFRFRGALFRQSFTDTETIDVISDDAVYTITASELKLLYW